MILSDEHIESFGQLFNVIYKGDPYATDLSFKLLNLAHVWDDLIDKDSPVGDEDINGVFLDTVMLQDNPLWVRCGMHHHVLNVYLRWHDSDKMERDPASTHDDLIKCYMLRAGVYDIFVVLAFHLHGREWASEVGPMVRKFYGETPEEFIKEMRDA